MNLMSSHDDFLVHLEGPEQRVTPNLRPPGWAPPSPMVLLEGLISGMFSDDFMKNISLKRSIGSKQMSFHSIVYFDQSNNIALTIQYIEVL